MEKTVLQGLTLTPSDLTFDYTLPPGTESLVGKTTAEVLDIFAIENQENETFLVRKIGEGERKAVHKAGDLHLTGHVWLFNSKGEVILQERSAQKDAAAGLLTTSASGHIKSGQTMLSGSVEEVNEELGLQIQESDLIPLGYVGKTGSENTEIMGIFALPYEGKIEDLAIQEEEVAGVKSISIDDFENDLNDAERAKLYATTVKIPEYREMVVSSIRKILDDIK